MYFGKNWGGVGHLANSILLQIFMRAAILSTDQEGKRERGPKRKKGKNKEKGGGNGLAKRGNGVRKKLCACVCVCVCVCDP